MPAPTESEKSQLLAQRYLPHFPAAGEIVLFDRSWYNRAGVERVMGFCTQQQYESFLKTTPLFEREIIEDGIILIKYFFDVSRKVQEERWVRGIPLHRRALLRRGADLDVQDIRRLSQAAARREVVSTLDSCAPASRIWAS